MHADTTQPGCRRSAEPRLQLPLALAAVFVLLMTPDWARAAESVVVIVNAGNNDRVTAETILAIYSDTRRNWSNGSKVAIYELPVKASAREAFSKAVLNKTAEEAQADWFRRKMDHSIKTMPSVKQDKLVVRFVSKYPDAIGYVPVSLIAGQSDVRVVMRIP